MKPDSLASVGAVRSRLLRYGLQADKGFGQNFLVDAHALATIVDAAAITQSDTVLEIGPGLGVLTAELIQHAASVIAVELDSRLLPLLTDSFSTAANLELVHGDALQYDFQQLPPDSLLVANLPYNVATPLLALALESGRFKRLVFLVQREVADRLTAIPGSKAYGALSLIVKHFGAARRVRDVAPAAFYPPPKVTSAVVRIDVNKGTAPDPALFALIRTGFRHRRKTLRKNLVMAGYDSELVVDALAILELDPHVRAEALALGTFEQLQALLANRL